MGVETRIPPGKQIRNFILVLLGGILVGLLTVMGLVTYYSPSYIIPADSALVSPQVLSTFGYNASGKNVRFEFDRLELIYFNKETKKWESKPLDIEKYGRFFALVARDKSAKEEMDSLYGQTPEARILIHAKSATGVTEVFQEIQFAPDGDHFRVQLKENNDKRDWAYYTHKGVLQEVLKL